VPALLKQHQPRWVLVELGGNDGLRGFPPQQTEQTLRTIIKDIKAANAEPLLMQIRLPANYGRRYNEAFSAIYPALAKEFDIPLLPFYGGGLSETPVDAGRRHSPESRRAAVYRRLDGEPAGSLS
jgi:acyl-CoA thioesterase-1